MIRVALQMLVGDKLKYLTLVIGIAFASLLITQQASIFNGYARQTGAWIRDSSVGDLWVMDEQVDMSVDLKPMSDTTLNRIRGVDGVEWAVPMYYGFVSAVFPDGTRRNVRVIGLDDASLIGAPPTMVEGQLSVLRQDKAVIMNADLAAGPLTLKRDPSGPRPMRVGDRLSFNDIEVVVSGSYRATREFFWEPVFYTTFSRARFIYKGQRKGLQYVIVKVEPGQSVEQVRQRIAGLGASVEALTNAQWESRTMWWILQETGILMNFGITILLGLVIGLLVAGQTFYTFVIDNLRHFGSLKAMGVRNRAIVRMIVAQVAAVSLVGFGIGVGMAAMSGRSLGGMGLAFEMNWPIVVAGAIGILLCSLLAGLLGLVRVVRLEPGIVFRS